jgi:uncharacterized protein YcgL (UPF0745 family)
MQCFIYKGKKKPDYYLFVVREDTFDQVPESLMNLLGPIEYVMELDLTPDKILAQSDAGEVLRLLSEQGYYLQFPKQEGDLGGHG